MLQNSATKRMKKNKKKVAMTLAACGLMGAMAVGGTMAYLTDNEGVTNTFTVGKVQIDLTEPNKPDEDTPRVPNEEMQKDPTIKNTGENDAVMFVSFDIPMDNLVIAGYDGTKQEAADVELFDFRTTDGTYDSVNDGWVLISKTIAEDNSKATYLYGYEDTVAPDETIPSIFDYVRMANIVEGQIDGEKLELPVRAYAIQSGYLQSADNTTGNHDIVVGDAMSQETLTDIYEIFANQNPEAVAAVSAIVDDADTNGALDLSGAEIN